MRKNSFHIVLLMMLLTSGTLSQPVQAQTYEEKREQILNQQTNTRAEINVLNARIKTYEERVNQAENRYEELYDQFENLNRLIALQDDKIDNLEEEQQHIQDEIRLTEEEIDLREKDLKILIDNYKDILLYTYKNGRTSNLELVLASKSINQMLVRSYYLQKLEEQKTKQAEQIRVRQEELGEIKDELQQSHFKNQLVLDEIRDEKFKLSDQRSIQQQNVEKIKEESTDLLTELRKYRQEKENLENNISSLIAEEERLREAENERLARLAEARKIADASRRAEEVAKYSTPANAAFVSDERLGVYEQNFLVSKGNLPWPVGSTTISQRFGSTRNPLYGTRTEHLGINIVTDGGTDVKAIADGYVINITPVPGYGNVVLVNHGNYYTVYGNLSQIDVNRNDVVSSGTVIGKSGTEVSEMGETLFFSVRKNKIWLNPEEWLSAK